jgi:regulatory protein
MQAFGACLAERGMRNAEQTRMTTPPRRITALEPDPAHPGAVRVVVDGRLFCTVHDAVVRSGGLAVGAEWDDSRLKAASLAADEEGAWRTLLKALERRSFSVGEIRRRLRQKGHPPEAVDHAVRRAEGLRLLDDAAFARQFVQSRASRGRGPGRLRQDLRALSVAEPLIDVALREQWPEPEDALDLAMMLATRRARQLGAIPRDAKRRRLLGYLARRGFSGSRVSELVRRVLAESERTAGS